MPGSDTRFQPGMRLDLVRVTRHHFELECVRDLVADVVPAGHLQVVLADLDRSCRPTVYLLFSTRTRRCPLTLSPFRVMDAIATALWESPLKLASYSPFSP